MAFKIKTYDDDDSKLVGVLTLFQNQRSKEYLLRTPSGTPRVQNAFKQTISLQKSINISFALYQAYCSPLFKHLIELIKTYWYCQMQYSIHPQYNKQ